MTETRRNLPEVVDLLVEELQRSIKSVENAAAELLALTSNSPTIQTDVKKFLRGMQTPMFGNWTWS